MQDRDLLRRPATALALFWLPAIAMVATARLPTGWRTVAWTLALAVLGAACSVNAARCHRVHCYVTGPFFLIMAAVTLLYGSGVLQLGTRGWTAISLIVVIGTAVLCWVPEKIVGQYHSPR